MASKETSLGANTVTCPPGSISIFRTRRVSPTKLGGNLTRAPSNRDLFRDIEMLWRACSLCQPHACRGEHVVDNRVEDARVNYQPSLGA